METHGAKKVLAFALGVCYTVRHSFPGGIAQLVERLNGIQKVRSSTLLTSTIKRKQSMREGERGLAFFVGAAERAFEGSAASAGAGAVL